MLNETLTDAEIRAAVSANVRVVEMAALELTEREPRVIWEMQDDFIACGVIAAMESLKAFKRRFLSPEAIQAWIRKAARWRIMNEIRRIKTLARLRPSRGTMHHVSSVGKIDSDRMADADALGYAISTLTLNDAAVFIAINADGERGIDVARTLKISAVEVCRRNKKATAKVRKVYEAA